MLELKRIFLLSSCLVTLVTGAVTKGPPEAEWPKISPKSAYARALGPPFADVSTISVPYIPKSPLFPKFVDPKMMIAKKTDMLSNLFGGLGPAMYNPMVPYGGVSGLQGALDSGDDKSEAKEMTAPWLESVKVKPVGDGTLYRRGIFGPFGSKFGSMGPMGPMSPMIPPKFGPMAQYPGSGIVPDYTSMKDDFSRKRRSIDMASVPNLQVSLDDTKNWAPPPAYPTLSPIPEQPEAEGSGLSKKVSATVPQEYMPGMVGPMVDPSMFITKKYTFLDTLFKNLATSTPSPTTTETPIPKSSIVPPSFWFPTSLIPSPTEYDSKVSDFLDKLFDSLELNKTTSSVENESMSPKSDFMRSTVYPEDTAQGRIARSIQDLSSISAAKDAILDNIMSELGSIKGDMMTTMDDLIAYEQTVAASTMPKKALKPFAPSMWPKPTVDATLPFKQKMMVLSQVFDMLTQLQKNITTAIQDAVKAGLASSEAASSSSLNVSPPSDDNYPVNLTLLEALKKKLSSSDADPSPYTPTSAKLGSKFSRMIPQSPTSFWVSYPEPAAGTVKRQTNDELSVTDDDNDRNDQRQHTRTVKMQMHQGFQSLPAGSVESVQAGGGSTPNHQGGGIKLLGTNPYGAGGEWFDWTPFLRNEYQGDEHHHHRH